MISSNSRTVTADITAVLTAPKPVNLAATLIYSAGDPYAVQVNFHVGAGEPLGWCLAREVLAAGLDGPAPEIAADVRVWPDETRGLLCIGLTSSSGSVVFKNDEARGHPRVGLTSSSSSGSAVFETDEAPVAEFLARSYQLVPEGEETAHLYLDADLADLLREAS